MPRISRKTIVIPLFSHCIEIRKSGITRRLRFLCTVNFKRNGYIGEAQNREAFRSGRIAADKQIESLKQKLMQNRRFRASLRENYKDGILSKQDYTIMKSSYDNEKGKLQQELDTLIHGGQRQNNTPSSNYYMDMPTNEVETGFVDFSTDWNYNVLENMKWSRFNGESL